MSRQFKIKDCECGGYAHPIHWTQIQCDNCNKHTNFFRDPEDATVAWNKDRVTGQQAVAPARPPIPAPAQSGTALDAKHYQGGRSEPIEDMQDDFSQDGIEGFLRGNILKYVRRFGKKGPKLSDAQKIAQYGKWLVDVCEGKMIDPREGK